MSVTTDGDKVYLEGDPLGPTGAYKQLAAAPAGTDVMFFLFRAFWDSVTTDAGGINFGWDHTFAFGLSFDGVFPNSNFTPTFSRFIGIGKSSTSFDLDYRADAGGVGKHFAGFDDGSVFRKGQNADDGASFPFIDDSDDLGGRNRRMFTMFPATPAIGAQVVQVWKIARSLSNSRYVSVTCGVNFESLSEANISNARTSANTVWSKTQELDASDNFCPRNNKIFFPSWLLMKNPDGTTGRKFVYDHGKVEYFKYSDSP